MAYAMREPRGDELEEALAFAREHGRSIESAQVQPHLSVLARDEQGGLQGMALCVMPRPQLTLEVVAHPEADDALTRQLVDKALLKLRSEHVRRCIIHTTSEDGHDPFWSTARWGDPVAAPSATVAS